MLLKHPNSDRPFIVSPGYFLGGFDIYDREETLGERLNAFNPNDKNQLRLLLDDRFFKGAIVDQLSVEHKAELMRVLEDALNAEDFDFGVLVSHERDTEDYFTLPSSWDIKEPRLFFLNIYDIALERWGNDFISSKAPRPHPLNSSK